jgi:hypothetical protein
MHDNNVIQFTASAERSSRSPREAPSITAVIQFLPTSKKQSQLAAFPKMAVLAGSISTDISLNENLRHERQRKWWAASAKAEVLRAMMDMHTKMSIAREYDFPEVRGYPSPDPAEYNRLLADWRKAMMDLLLTPAPDLKSLTWKRHRVERLCEWDWVGVKPARVERAIADDDTFLKAHPARQKSRPAEAPSQ